MQLHPDAPKDIIYTPRTLSGELQVVRPWLLRALVESGLWDEHMRNLIIANNGSVQNIDIIVHRLPSSWSVGVHNIQTHVTILTEQIATGWT